MNTMVKILVSALIIGAVTEVARKFPAYGGIVAALPLVSLLSLIWLYVQGEQTAALSKFALGVIWGLPATIVLLVIVYAALQFSINIWISIGMGLSGWLGFLFIQKTVVIYVRSLFFS